MGVYRLKKKVLIVLPEMETGGGQRLAISIAHHITSGNLIIRILVLYPRRGDILEGLADEYGLDVQYLHKNTGADVGLMKEIYFAIQEFKPDVIHAHLRVMPYLLLPMCLAGKQKRYYTVHNLAQKDASGIKRKILKFAFKHCHVTPVAISDLCRGTIHDIYGLQEDKILCIYNGIDTQRFAPPHGYTYQSPFKFVAIGRMAIQKNYPLLLAAFCTINRQYPQTKLVIVGDGELRNELEDTTRNLGMREAVEFTGNISDVEVRLWEAQAYVMSSDYEGLPLTVLEAMAAGLPIISTRAGGVVDVVRNNENGFLVECGDKDALVSAMKALIQSPSMCNKFSTNSIELSRQYSIEDCAASYEALYLS